MVPEEEGKGEEAGDSCAQHRHHGEGPKHPGVHCSSLFESEVNSTKPVYLHQQSSTLYIYYIFINIYSIYLCLHQYNPV